MHRQQQKKRRERNSKSLCPSFYNSYFPLSDIIGTEELPPDVSTSEGVRFYPWTIDNKYYSADIHLCVVPNRFLVTPEIAECVQAFLIYFDSTTVSTSALLYLWVWRHFGFYNLMPLETKSICDKFLGCGKFLG